MPTPTVARAEQLAAQLLSAGIPATHDANQLLKLAPAVLIPPPRLTFAGYGGPTAAWRLLIVASSADPLVAWKQLDELLHLAADALSIEAAEPVSYAASATDDPMPAYALTLTD